VHYLRDRTGVTVTLGGDLTGPSDPAEPAETEQRDEVPVGDRADPRDPVAPLPASMRVTRTRALGDFVSLEVDGLSSGYHVRRAGEWVLVTGLGRTTTFRVLSRHPDASEQAHDHGLATPVPGTVTQVLVGPGDTVAAGDTLVILEAMKMEHRIKADGDGVVAEVRVAVGDSVDAHHVVAVLEE
jgi:biotin carboxyl carrier protein